MENCRNARVVLFHWWPFGSKRNDEVQLFYTDISLTQTSKPTITLLDICLKWCFIKFSFHFEGVLLAVRECTSMFRGCSRPLKTPNSPPLSKCNLQLFTIASSSELAPTGRKCEPTKLQHMMMNGCLQNNTVILFSISFLFSTKKIQPYKIFIISTIVVLSFNNL